MKLFKRGPTRLERLQAEHETSEARLRGDEPAIPAGALIFTSWSPKVKCSHRKSALNPGAVCETFRLREEPWLGTGSDDERARAASLPPCPVCAKGDARAADERRSA